MKKKRSIVARFLRFLLIAFFLPLYLIFRVVDRNTPRTQLSRIVGIFFICIILLPIWIAGYGISGYAAMNSFGYITEPINISGTGSMYPTFPKGEGKDPKELSRQLVSTPGMFRYPNGIILFGTRYFNHVLTRGDIVVVENPKIQEINNKLYDKPGGLVKRLIALPGDTLELRDGNVILNGIPQKEPYIARARSTFGGEFLSECKIITIPAGKYFIMGDNRKASGDSRHEVGLVNETDIKYVFPYSKQKGTLDKNWHDPVNDLTNSAKITLDAQAFIKILNEKRKELGSKELRYEPKLQFSAKKRGDMILRYDDFSFEGTRSGYPMTRATADANYYNIVYGEWPILGSYDAGELFENLFQFPEGKQFLTNNEYQDVGISETQGLLNGCPSQIVVLHFAGYKPPDYSKDVVESWKKLLINLQDVQPGWQKLKTFRPFYDNHVAEVNRINDIIAERIREVTGIVDKMTNNQWLSGVQQKYIERDKQLQAESEALAEKLNSYQR